MMNDYVIFEGDSYDDALAKGLSGLNLDESQVKVEILEERKSSFFRKGFTKIKIFPMIENIELDNGLNQDIQNLKEDNFYLDYRPDGVYLTVLKESSIDISFILDYLSKKSVKEYDYEKIVECINDKQGSAEKIAPYQEEVVIDSELEIKVSNDKLHATILLTKPYGGKEFSVFDIIDCLNEKNIKFGIDNKKIEEIVNNCIYNNHVIVAKGQAAIRGDDGKINCYFDDNTEEKNTVVEEDGRIDYKNLNKIRNVQADDLLIEIIPPTDGVDGIDVFGNTINANKGNQVIIKKGKNVYESEDGLKFYASKSGEVYFVDNTIYVDEVKNIEGNIDNETGNVMFNGKINIRGNVKSGFKVEAEGDIEVFGVVEGATLISKGNIVIHRGVQGNNQASLNCLGDLKVKYLENTSVKCGGNIESDAILHSEIIAKGKILAIGRKGLIVGGDIRAGQEVRANVIGSNMGTSTKIEVGIDPEEKNYYEQVKAEINDIEKNLDSSKKAIDLLNKMSKKGELTKQKQELLIKSLNTYKVLKTKYDTLANELKELTERLKESNNGKIHASSIIHPGVRVIIGSSPKHIYDEISNCTLYIKDGEVTIGPYER